jgi:transcriptional regulator with XRE-family HTH domain
MSRVKTKMELYKELGDFLAAKRTAAGLNQKEVSDKMGYSSAQFVSNFERGLCMPPLNKLKLLSDMYAIEPKELAEFILKYQKQILYRELKIKTS